jgi:hypothetical protein
MVAARCSIVALVLLAVAPVAVVGNGVTPIQKVLTMIDDMIVKGKSEKHVEETEFAEFQQWCDSTREATKKSITEAAARIEQLEADIIKADADAEEAAEDAKELTAQADKEEAEAAAATAVRKQEKADYDATHTDLSESIDAVERALSVLKSREADVPQSLMQLRDSVHLPAEAKASIEALLAISQAPEANAYEFQGGGVVDMLEKLRLKFQDELLALQKAEIASKGNFEVLLQRLTQSVADQRERADAKTAFKAQRTEDSASAAGDLDITKTGKAADEKTLSDTNTECDARSREFEKNQVVRSGEIKACEEATKILKSDAVSGNADKHLPSALLQDDSVLGVSLLQLKGMEMPEARARVVEFLQGRAKELGSRYLSLAASHVSADPFVKVKKMIKDMIVKLMEEANAEADKNAYCTTELATNKLTRENKQSEVDELSANIEKKTAESTKLGEEVAELSGQVAELKGQQNELTGIRENEKKTNAATVADAKEAQIAVEKATKVLKDFFASAAEASLLQDGSGNGLQQEMSEVAKAPYTGQQAGSGGIVGMLEVILSDFARLEAETQSAEDQAQSVYEKFMNESNQDIAVKDTEIKHKSNKKLATDGAIADLNKELQLTQEELGAALDYFGKLKEDCLATGLSYEERVQKREEEIQSLKEAMTILTQEDLS